MEPLFLEGLFRLQLLFQQLNVAVEQVLTLIQTDKALLHLLEAQVADAGNELSAHV